MSIYIQTSEKSQINVLVIYLKVLGKQTQSESKAINGNINNNYQGRNKLYGD